MDRNNPYYEPSEESPVKDSQPAVGDYIAEETVEEARQWDTFSGGSLAWGETHPEESHDYEYLTNQHPQASEVGVTDTEAGAQFFGREDEESWHAREGHSDVLLGGGLDRNLGKALLSTAVFAVIATVCFLTGRWPTLVLLILLLVLAAGEFFGALRKVGYQPAVLVAIASMIGLPIAVFWRGAQAYPMSLALILIATFCWYLVGVTRDRPVPNIAATIFGIIYLGVLGSFGALLLREEAGVGLFFGAVVATVAYDVFAWGVGKFLGRTKLSKASPNKTVEGLIGGILGSMLVCWLTLGLIRIAPWGEDPGSMLHAIFLGLFAGIAATLGDLSESMLKRDLGIKDMGRIIPGHGGILDRFDGLLFVLPVAWGYGLVADVISAAPS